MKISINDIMDIGDPRQYKLHLANQGVEVSHPLDEYVADELKWQGWNESRGKRNDWNRDYIFSLIEFYPMVDSWLFGGVYKVLERNEERYQLRKEDYFAKYEGRLILSFHRQQGLRGRAFLLESHIDKFVVAEILRDRYDGEAFPGFENININFGKLENIILIEKKDWKAALGNIKGIYLVCDRYNRKQYVGSAYGDFGVWARWTCYIKTGHGWNDELTEIISKKNIDYARRNFTFSLLEIMKSGVSDKAIQR